MCYIIFADICFISGIIDDYCTDFVCIVNPFLKLCFCDCRSCWIIWEAKINDIWFFFWEVWYEIVLCCTWHVDYIAPCFCCRIIFPCSPCHNVCVNINWVYRVTYSNFVIYTENFLNVSGITFCTIADKDFIGTDITSTALVVTICDCIS